MNTSLNMAVMVLKVVILALLLSTTYSASAIENACPVTLQINLDYDSRLSTLEVHYNIPNQSTNIHALSFPHLTDYEDYGFIQLSKNHVIDESGSLALNPESLEGEAFSLMWIDSPRLVRALYFPFMPLADNGALLLKSAFIPKTITLSSSGTNNTTHDFDHECATLQTENEALSFRMGAGYLFLTTDNSNVLDENSKITFINSTSLPEWLTELIGRESIQSFAYFKEWLGELDKPFRLAAGYTENSQHGVFRDAGVIHGPEGFDMAMRFVGQPFLNYDEGAALNISSLVAHEFFHAWNGGDLTMDGHAWVHEGSAEYAAKLYLKHSDALSDEDFANLISRTKRQCLLGLGERDFTTDNSFFLNYTCGLAIWASLLPDENTFFDFYAQLIKNRNEVTITPSRLIASLAHYSGFSEFEMDFLISSVALEDRYSHLLKVFYHGSQDQLLSNQADSARLLFSQIQAQLCRGRVNFSTHDDFMRFYQTDTCPAVFSESTFDAISLNQISLEAGQGNDLLAKYLKSCAQDQQFVIGLTTGETRRATCPIGHVALARAAYIGIE